jgi:hypothetical protein
MTFRTGKALVAGCAISLLCVLDAPANAQTSGGDSNAKSPAKSHSHRAAAKPEYAAVSQNGAQAQATQSAPPQYYPWGAPPRQDSRDAYQGYFANPVDNPRYYGTGRATLIFRQ